MKTEKKAFRKKALQIRDAIDPQKKAEQSALVRRRLTGMKAYVQADTILVFVSLPGEIDTIPLIDMALEEGKTVAVPLVTGRRKMVFIRIDSRKELREGTFSVLEPVMDREKITEQGLVLMPGLAFDKNCFRMGYGGGFYDCWLTAHPEGIRTIALAFDEQIFDRVPAEPSDMRPDMVLTATRLFKKEEP